MLKDKNLIKETLRCTEENETLSQSQSGNNKGIYVDILHHTFLLLL